MNSPFTIENSPFGRVVVAPAVPAGYAVFYTTSDFDGRITDGVAGRIGAYVGERFAIEAQLVTCTQVHGRRVARAKREDSWRECDACDALWAGSENVVLGIKVADCLPITMLDSMHGVIAGVHAGWRGVAQRIADETIDSIEASSRFSPAHSLAYLGPAIRACCFEVGEEVVERLTDAYGDVSPFVDRSRAQPHVDLTGIIRSRLIARGFTPEAVYDCGLCTRCGGSMFHSYRRDGKGGRNLALVAH